MNQPELSSASLADLPQVRVMDENGEFRDAEITGERPLTIYVDKNEIVTLMTLGSHPELLTLGYLFNQRFINDLNEVRSVQVD
ncbi:MAG: formate dehydrogenase accessory sulfurtransferase FdhD, partial [SAR324 cluster bacterium]|nr:formate dehydrogenase accessory sulfurtransferase FdhD [SAR324 cluster bacterium]